MEYMIMQENPHVTHVSLNSSNRMFLSAFLHETCHYVNNLKGEAEYEYMVGAESPGVPQVQHISRHWTAEAGPGRGDGDRLPPAHLSASQVRQVRRGGGCGGHGRVHLGLGQALVHLQHQRVWSGQEPQVQATVQVWQENLLQVCYK